MRSGEAGRNRERERVRVALQEKEACVSQSTQYMSNVKRLNAFFSILSKAHFMADLRNGKITIASAVARRI